MSINNDISNEFTRTSPADFEGYSDEESIASSRTTPYSTVSRTAIGYVKTVAPHIPEEEIQDICRYVQQNAKDRLQEARDNGRSIYLCPKATQLARAIQFTPEGDVIVHLNRQKKGDKLLGQGTYKKVKLAIDWNNQKTLASASSTHCMRTRGENYPLQVEVKIGKRIEGLPNCVQMVGNVEYEKTSKKQRIVTTYCNRGSLDLAICRRQLKPKDRRSILEGLVGAVYEIHKKNTIHGDIKTDNVLLNEEESESPKVPFLADFGGSCSMEDEEGRKNCVSTPLYWSPEHARTDLPGMERRYIITPADDMWALGCTLYLVLGMGGARGDQLPWERGEHIDLEMIREFEPFQKPKDEASPEYLVWLMLQDNLKKRISSETAFASLSSIRWPDSGLQPK